MANFKGGFSFNNEAAKVEVEQAPDGTLISCVNPVTGEELGGGGGGVDVYRGTFSFKNDARTAVIIGASIISDDKIIPLGVTVSSGGTATLSDLCMQEGAIIITKNAAFVSPSATNCSFTTAEYTTSGGTVYGLIITPTDDNSFSVQAQ